MCTEVTGDTLQINRPPPTPGVQHHVELVALMDVLAVPNVCGNDVGRTSNFALKPIRLSVFDASAADLGQVPPLRSYPHSQRGPKDFRQPVIKADRPLSRDPGYVPAFTNVPLRETVFDLVLDTDEQALLRQAGLEAHYGDDDAGMLRDLTLSWWERNFTSFLPGTAP